MLEFLHRPEEDGYGGMEGDNGIVIEDVCGDDLQNLGGRLVLMFIRADILASEVVVVVVGVMVVVTVGETSFSEKRCLTVTEVECLGVRFGLMGGDVGGFGAVVVEMEVDDLELEVEVRAVIRLVWSSVNGRLYFLWRLIRMSLKGKISNNGGGPFCMVIWADPLMEFFFLDGGYLGKLVGSKNEMVVVEMAVGVVERMI